MTYGHDEALKHMAEREKARHQQRTITAAQLSERLASLSPPSPTTAPPSKPNSRVSGVRVSGWRARACRRSGMTTCARAVPIYVTTTWTAV
jgi:hypothetical protein